ncbi:hypothetical protein VUR80DRAFT_5627 [Thermomyces stellatus]
MRHTRRSLVAHSPAVQRTRRPDGAKTHRPSHEEIGAPVQAQLMENVQNTGQRYSVWPATGQTTSPRSHLRPGRSLYPVTISSSCPPSQLRPNHP